MLRRFCFVLFKHCIVKNIFDTVKEDLNQFTEKKIALVYVLSQQAHNRRRRIDVDTTLLW